MTKASTTKAPTAKSLAKSKVVANMAATKKLQPATTDDHSIQPEQRAADAVADRRVANDAMNFAVQQLATPTVPNLKTPAQLTDAFKAELAALQAKHGIAAKAVVVKAPKADKVQQNGVTRPAADTLCGKIWHTADVISHNIHGICPVALLKEHPDVKEINNHTIKTQYARWRAFNGVHGRLPTIPQVHQTQGEYPGIPEVK